MVLLEPPLGTVCVPRIPKMSCVAVTVPIAVEDVSSDPNMEFPWLALENAVACLYGVFKTKEPPATAYAHETSTLAPVKLGLNLEALGSILLTFPPPLIATKPVAPPDEAVDPSTYKVPSSCRYHELNAVPVMVATSAALVAAALVVGM